MREILEKIDRLLATCEGRQYAVFDFDKTCINNDIQELLYAYQAREFCYRMTPEEFANLMGIHEQLLPEYRTMADEVLAMEKEAVSLFGECYAIEDCKRKEAFFSVMMKLLDVGDDYCDTLFTYQWVLEFWKGFTAEEITKLAMKVYQDGAKVNDQVWELMEYLVSREVDIYIVSASSYEAVSGAVIRSGYDAMAPVSNILALRICDKPVGYIPTIKEGKEKAIRSLLLPRYDGRLPIFSAGDSRGDYWMMRMLEEEGIRVVVGENQSFLQSLAKSAIEYFKVEETK